MEFETIITLAKRLTTAKAVDSDLLKAVADAVRPVLPGTPFHPEALSDPTEAVVHMVDKSLPGWSISLSGRAVEPDGHWICTLRESNSRDNDAVIGIGTAPTVALAMLSALVKVASLAPKL